MCSAITVSVHRRTEPERTEDAVAWVEEGLTLAKQFAGCLGGGVLRDSEDRALLHVVYRFTDEHALDSWEASPVRQAWLHSGECLVVEAKIQRRTGIEDWFDGPQVRRSVDARTGEDTTVKVRSAPVRWKQAIAIWVGMYPLNILTSSLIMLLPWWNEVPVPLRSALMVTVLAPTMTFVMMPAVTRFLRPWLRRNPGVIRTERALTRALDQRAAQAGCS